MLSFLKFCIEWIDSNPEICIKANAYYQDKNDCRFYYHCDLSYTAHRKQCFKGLYFDQNKRTCVYPKYTNCYDESESHHVNSCPAGLHWNDKIKLCDLPRNAGCHSTDRPTQSTTTPEPDITTTTEKVTTNETSVDEITTYETTKETKDMISETELNTETTFSPNFTCPTENGSFAHDDCWMYWECANGIAYERKCADGTAWNDRIKMCDWPANIVSNVKCYIPGKTYIWSQK